MDNDYMSMLSETGLTKLKSLSEVELLKSVCAVTDLTLIQLAYVERLHEALEYLKSKPSAVMAVNNDSSCFIEMLFLQEGIEGIKNLGNYGHDVFSKNAIGNTLMDVFIGCDDYNPLVKKYISEVPSDYQASEGISVTMSAALSGSVKNLSTCLNAFPEEAADLLNLSIVQGKVRECVESFVASTILNEKAPKETNGIVLNSSSL